MSRDTCRLPGCENAPGEQERDDYRASSFCSAEHEVKFDHLRDDARDARQASETQP